MGRAMQPDAVQAGHVWVLPRRRRRPGHHDPQDPEGGTRKVRQGTRAAGWFYCPVGDLTVIGDFESLQSRNFSAFLRFGILEIWHSCDLQF